MSQEIEQYPEGHDEAVRSEEAPGEVPAMRGERGMTTAEYAIGVVLVITLVSIVIKALEAGWFGTLVKNLISLVFKTITGSMG